MMIAIDEFRQIMTKPAPNEGEEIGEPQPNPLLRNGGDIPEGMDRTIAAD